MSIFAGQNPFFVRVAYFSILFLLALPAQAQYYRQPDASRIRLNLKKLNTLGTVLYVAAHPDDENTLSIGYFANERQMYTGYLSMTRGDGGQNLIGGELRDKLGLIRTRELIAARGVDGGRQFFTRANDFGFSKNADETLRIWDKEVILADVLKVIRKFKPDVMITRFPPDARAGHGHHTSSALLALEAFELAGRPDVLPEQVSEFGAWQPRRLYLNVSRFFDASVNEKTPGIITVDMGGYNPLLGKSYNELSAESRTMHKSQGFGSAARRGYLPEFFLHQKGDSVKADLLEGINTSWSRVMGGERIDPLVRKLQSQFKDETPWTIVPGLLELRRAIRGLDPGIWRERKLAETDDLIRDCLGLYAEFIADRYHLVSGETSEFSFQAVNRSPVQLQLSTMKLNGLLLDSVLSQTMETNRQVNIPIRKPLVKGMSLSAPYWLREPHPQGYFTVNQPELITLPENPPALEGSVTFRIGDEELMMKVPVFHKSTDPVKGEIYRPVEILPPVIIGTNHPVVMFPDHAMREITVRFTSVSRNSCSGVLEVHGPSGWEITPSRIPFEFSKPGQVFTFPVQVTPSAGSMSGELRFSAVTGEWVCNTSVEEITYNHIPVQTLQPPAMVRLVRAQVAIAGQRIGYVPGAGDEIPDALRAIGYQVTELKDPLPASALSGYDAIVMGVRALNANPVIRDFMPALLQYAEAGGTLVLQYNTSFETATDRFAPYELKLSRFRVTEEDAEVRFLRPDHPVLNIPNKITQEDFKGWVQERGLYFPGSWGPQFQPVVSMNDAGEHPGDGAILVAEVGKGHYVYTALSFFRQLPEGVPGAFRLFANLVSLRGKQMTALPMKSKRKK